MRFRSVYVFADSATLHLRPDASSRRWPAVRQKVLSLSCASWPTRRAARSRIVYYYRLGGGGSTKPVRVESFAPELAPSRLERAGSFMLRVSPSLSEKSWRGGGGPDCAADGSGPTAGGGGGACAALYRRVQSCSATLKSKLSLRSRNCQ